ncbi:uncharacterized protein LOC111301052 [Durio zibethinus]|uniref:Uncharacterized protein LOC111301052 n=1 Tax=Durio zibethinus TaxID=66656 RepID=A0A6P5ZHT6_DURZI|nr:uncharacterized protein LOC111301052 [Durio zibethinus]
MDYKTLNKVTAKYFFKLDLKSGYHHIRVAERDASKITCVMRYDAFEFLVMPFGLTNALAIFCTLMNQFYLKRAQRTPASCVSKVTRPLVKRFSRKTTTLIELLKNEHKWCWINECQKAFERLKEVIMKDPVLALSEIKKPFEV